MAFRFSKTILCISLLLITILIFYCCSAARADDLVILEKITDSDLCSSNKVADVQDVINLENYKKTGLQNSVDEAFDYQSIRNSIVRNFDTERYRCLEFTNGKEFANLNNRHKPQIQKNSGSIVINQKLIPIIISRTSEFNNSHSFFSGTIFVRIPGGPGGAEVFTQFDDLIEYESDTIGIDFFYTGNGFNLIYPDPNFDLASGQLALFLTKLRDRNPNARIVLVGESLGTVISIAAIDKIGKNAIPSKNVVNELILLSPPFASLDDVGKKLLELYGTGPSNQRSVLYRVRSNDAKYNDYGKIRTLDWYNVFTKFYKPKEGRLSLHERLNRSIRRPPVLIIYGTSDRRIGSELAGRFIDEPITNIQTASIKGMGHQPSTISEHRDIIDEIGYFLSE